MKFKYKLDNIIDTKRNRHEIESVVQSIAYEVTEQYKKYDATITHVTYDSSKATLMEANITFVVDCKGFYPIFSITIPLTISLKPVHLASRNFMGYFTMGGVDQSFREEIENTYDIIPNVMYQTMDSSASSTDKVKDLFNVAEDHINGWKSIVVASDIFLF
jgi:hypothetical protein